MSENTGKKAGAAVSKVLKSGRAGKAPKAAAGSALTQRAMSRPAKLSSSDADRAVKRYLEKRAG